MSLGTEMQRTGPQPAPWTQPTRDNAGDSLSEKPDAGQPAVTQLHGWRGADGESGGDPLAGFPESHNGARAPDGDSEPPVCPPLITGRTGSLVGSVRARADPKGICLLPTHPQAGPHGPYLGMAQSCTCCLKRHS